MPGHSTAPPLRRDVAEPAPAGRRSARKLLRPASQLADRMPPGWRVPPGWRAPLLTYLACQVIFLLWWAAFFPALISADTVTYVAHVTTGPWSDNHSVLYDSMVWLSLHATGGLAGLTLVQTMAMSASLAYTVSAFRRLGVPGRWTATAAVVVAALPVTGTLVVFVWKDTAFAICTYLLVPTLARLNSLRGSPGWRADPRVNRLITALGLELLGVALFRQDGFLVVALAAVALVCLLRGVRGRLAAAALAAICLTFVLNLLVYPAAGIQRPPASLTYGPAYADIAVAYAAKPSSFTRADLRLMGRVAPLAQWKNTANCYDSDTTTNIPGFLRNSPKVSSQLFSLWLRILNRSPGLIVAARICRGSVAWSIFPPPGGGHLAPIDSRRAVTSPFHAANVPRVAGNPYRSALNRHPLSQPLNHVMAAIHDASTVPQLEWLLWRAPFWCYLSYLVLFVFARARRNWALLSIGAVVAAQQLTVLADNPVQLYRYMVGPIVIGIMLIPLFFARHRSAPAMSQ